MLEHTIGLYGGTFDPVHLAHVRVVESALQAGIQSVTVMPCRRSPHKLSGQQPTSAEHRWEMLKIAFDQMERVQLSRYEIDGPDTSFTWQTVEHLRSSGQPLSLIIGMDQLLALPEWARFHEWKDDVHFYVLARPGSEKKPPPGLEDLRITFNETPVGDISATEIRAKLARNPKLQEWLPAGVYDYICEHHLYGCS